jgi:peptide/nickel transport system permease protein
LILAESALSFLNLGVMEPTPSWGNMLSESQGFFRQAPHLVVLPGLLIVIVVLCTYLIGDGLRDAFDPQAVK